MKNHKRILIISPAFPSAINGVGDYSYMLGAALNTHKNFHISYAGLPQTQKINVAPYHEINTHHHLYQVITEEKIDVVFLNYVNYGYQNKGLPFWLLKSLKKLKNKQLHIFFHELNATSYKPWKLTFWIKPLQIYLYKRLAQIADKIYCSNDIIYGILIKDFPNKLSKIGIFSNIIEPAKSLSPISKRKNIAIVFGSYTRRHLVYQKYQQLNQFIQQNGIQEIIDIGAGDITHIQANINIPIIQKGVLSNEEIANLLAEAKYGFIHYLSSLFGKSGIFAAYAAYGLVIVNFEDSHNIETENLIEGSHYISIKSHNVRNSLIHINHISNNILLWYSKRNLHTHTDFIKNKL